jgi:hypothetical protein
MTTTTKDVFQDLVEAAAWNIATLDDLVSRKSASKSAKARQWSICFHMLQSIQEHQGSEDIWCPIVKHYLDAAKTEVQGLLGAFVRPYMGIANVNDARKGTYSMGGCFTVFDLFAYFTDCNLATLSEMYYTKSTGKGRKARQVYICKKMITTCRKAYDNIKWEYGIQKRFSRVSDILDRMGSSASIEEAFDKRFAH